MWKFIEAIGPTLIAIVSILVTLKITKDNLQSQSVLNTKILNAQKSADNRHTIRRKLDEFYGPLIQQRMKSSNLYEKFSKKYRDGDKNFSTLIYLMKGHPFSENDKVLLEQIIKLGEDSERLIQEKSGLIDDIDLRLTIIPKATTHFLLIKLAHEGKLKDNPDDYQDMVYPIELVPKLEERKRQLEQEFEELNRLDN